MSQNIVKVSGRAKVGVGMLFKKNYKKLIKVIDCVQEMYLRVVIQIFEHKFVLIAVHAFTPDYSTDDTPVFIKGVYLKIY